MAATLKENNTYIFPDDISSSDFKSDFVWGSATSAYQIEGAAFEGGRQPSIWDAFCLKNPGAIDNGDNGNKAIKAYYKTKEDVQMMKKMGLKAYRFSISWSRLLPGGKASMGINQEGVDYYNNLINELIENGITPYATLFHWDLPNALEEDYMGFLSELVVLDFVDYAEFCFWEFGDRVKHWITLNEPYTFAAMGYAYGTMAPGRGGGDTETQQAVLASGNNLGTRNRARAFNNKEAGNPATGNPIMLILSDYTEIDSRFMNSIFNGKYPQSMIDNVTDGRLPEFTDKQIELLTGSFNFLGLNYYTAQYATTAAPTDVVSYLTDSKVHQQPDDLNGVPIGPQGGVYWFYSYPLGLYKSLMQIKSEYGDPTIYITENGWPDANNNDLKLEEARVDEKRVNYYNTHLQSLRDAIRDGSKVVGYFAWSLMDNFEWASGYSVRFGLFYIDYAHGKYTRYPKTSAIWFMRFLNAKKAIEINKAT
uniref:Beta-glucosidase n=3 Tax=Lactuca sativa TaxID=4236 RepID=A0A9R1WIU4_LACSA|nr:hypothetical protein LSAT_V11C100007740 [Lactuca sativa]KAJ0227557.1 hypothetical protein LSAT_V11C100007680 [Lactuca sativa]KAJ0228408.1 hypothetical protein LSAT_V11C100007660 [Lactuca sativa]